MKKTHKKIRIKGGGVAYLRNTSELDDKVAAAMVRHGLADLNIGHCAVHIKQGKYSSYLGLAYYDIPAMSSAPLECEHLITARYWGKSEGIPRLVNTLAHEGLHIEDYREGRRARNKQRRQTETRARAWGGRRQREWEADRL